MPIFLKGKNKWISNKNFVRKTMITITNFVYKSCRRFTVHCSQQSFIHFFGGSPMHCLSFRLSVSFELYALLRIIPRFSYEACVVYVFLFAFSRLIGPCNLYENIITLCNQFAHGRGHGNIFRFRIYFWRSNK